MTAAGRRNEAPGERPHDTENWAPAALAGGAAVLAAPRIARAAETVKIGYVSPQTGPLAPFGEADSFILDGVRKALAKGISAGGKNYPVAIVVKDSQSNPNRAAKLRMS